MGFPAVLDCHIRVTMILATYVEGFLISPTALLKWDYHLVNDVLILGDEDLVFTYKKILQD